MTLEPVPVRFGCHLLPGVTVSDEVVSGVSSRGQITVITRSGNTI